MSSLITTFSSDTGGGSSACGEVIDVGPQRGNERQLRGARLGSVALLFRAYKGTWRRTSVVSNARNTSARTCALTLFR